MRKFILFLLVAVSLSLFAADTLACICQSTTTSQNKKEATAVFLATIIDKKKSDVVLKNGIEMTLDIGKVWKGKISKTESVYSEGTGDLYGFIGGCSPLFTVGQSYLFFVSGREKLTNIICASTSVSIAQNVLKELGKGKKPRKRK